MGGVCEAPPGTVTTFVASYTTAPAFKSPRVIAGLPIL